MSKEKGAISIKEKEQNKKIQIFEKVKKSNLYKDVLEKFPDANLVEALSKKKENK